MARTPYQELRRRKNAQGDGAAAMALYQGVWRKKNRKRGPTPFGVLTFSGDNSYGEIASSRNVTVAGKIG
jgi:hypothetical protein